MTENRKQKSLYKNVLKTPLGPMVAVFNEQALCFLAFANEANIEVMLQKLANALGRKYCAQEAPLYPLLTRELDLYFARQLQQFSVPIEFIGTDFQRQVWQMLLQIPYGQTWSYQQQANALQRPQAVRAVAAANGANKIAILVPCHRVIGSTGKLVGYSAGTDRKKALLELENSQLQF